MPLSRHRPFAVAVAVAAVLLPSPPALAASNGGQQTAAAVAAGNGFIVQRAHGITTVTWRVHGTLPTGDARPEFAVNGTVVGVPTPSADGASLVLRSATLGQLDVRKLSTVAAGRRLDAAGAQRQRSQPTFGARSTGKPPVLTGPTATLSPDPGRRGGYRTRSFSYRQPGLRLPGLPARVEVLADVVLPTRTTGARPVVVLLHGRHITCYNGKDADIGWPCAAPLKPIPSQRGYGYLQQLLASQGYATVSIAANGINGQDDTLADSGAGARSALVRHHLDLLARWNAGTGTADADATALKGTLNLKKLLLVGHSRGGEGVNRAAIDIRASDPYRVAGQVLVAPTDFGRQVAVGVPTTVLLPYCDGDVSDLQGQQYVDQGRSIAAGDRSLRSAVMIMGANHNYFNTEWTPGLSKAPSNDDWYDQSDRVCGKASTQRLSAAQQRAAGASYVAAAAQTYLSGSSSAVQLLDGTPVRSAAAGQAVALTEAVGGPRQALYTAAATDTLHTQGSTSATRCAGYAVPPATSTAGLCSARAAEEQLAPHWLTSSTLPAPQAARIRWTAAGGGATLATGTVRDISSATAVDLRVIADPTSGAPTFDVVLTDDTGRSQTFRPAQAAQRMPQSGYGARYWAQTVRVVLPRTTTVDRTRLVSLTLRPTSSAGRVFLLDAYGSRTGQTTSSVNVQQVARIDVPSTTLTVQPTPSGIATVRLTLPITGRSAGPAQVWVEAASASDGTSTGRSYSIKPGQTSLTVPLTVIADGTYSTDPVQYYVTAYALRNAVTGSYVGVLAAQSDAAPPTLTALEPHVEVTQGGMIRWTVRLSAPMRGWYSTGLELTKPADGPELTSAQVLRSWSDSKLSAPRQPDGTPNPLSASAPMWSLDLSELQTTSTVEIPTAGAPLTADRYVTVEVQPDGVLLTQPLRLTAVVHPPTP